MGKHLVVIVHSDPNLSFGNNAHNACPMLLTFDDESTPLGSRVLDVIREEFDSIKDEDADAGLLPYAVYLHSVDSLSGKEYLSWMKRLFGSDGVGRWELLPSPTVDVEEAPFSFFAGGPYASVLLFNACTAGTTLAEEASTRYEM